MLLLLALLAAAGLATPASSDPIAGDLVAGELVAADVAPRPEARWWSLRSLSAPALPELPAEWAEWPRDPLDAFVLKRLLDEGLTPSPEADRRTLLRRVSIDLIGLPPTPDEMRAFLADERVDAYERAVDALLASPRHGERWARHWLDVVHYADTHGYDKDKPRRHAWPYRDWVIEALNEDLPWARFVALQVAGDALDPSAGVVATGMLAAGPWDYVGQVELAEGTTDKRKTRNLDRDDVVTNVFGAFQSLTVNCARCHDHKFDPVSQAEYYDLQAVFAGVERADRRYDADPEVARQRARLEGESAERRQQLEQLASELDALVQQSPAAQLLVGERERIAAALPAVDRSARLGWHSELASDARQPKWVEVDLGSARAIELVRAYPCDEAYGGHPGPGFGLPPELELWSATDPDGPWTLVERRSTRARDGAHADRPLEFRFAAPLDARLIRLRSEQLWERTKDYCFALAELEVVGEGENLARDALVQSSDSIEAGERWGARFLVDGRHPWSPELAALDELERALSAAREELAGPQHIERRARRAAELVRVERELAALPEPSLVYAATASFRPEGNFQPPPDGRPRLVQRLERGDVDQPREPSTPGAVAALAHLPARFELPADADESARRLALAEWLTHPDNPLTWRSAVNRLWQGHFGRGLVATPSDFGHMGALPTHPELLEHLATRFRDGGGSSKALHRALVCSATYRQSSAQRDEAAALDAGNRFLWRANRRRMEAESLRDSVLAATGELELAMGGPGFEAFGFEDDHSPRYLYDAIDVDDARLMRRSIYRFVVRSVPDPWMAVFDCADPSVCTPKRLETTTPLQAASLLNDAFLLRRAQRFAQRLEREGGDPIEGASWLVWQRGPSEQEARLLAGHARDHGLAAVCRVLFNSSEFLYVD